MTLNKALLNLGMNFPGRKNHALQEFEQSSYHGYQNVTVALQ